MLKIFPKARQTTTFRSTTRARARQVGAVHRIANRCVALRSHINARNVNARVLVSMWLGCVVLVCTMHGFVTSSCKLSVGCGLALAEPVDQVCRPEDVTNMIIFESELEVCDFDTKPVSVFKFRLSKSLSTTGTIDMCLKGDFPEKFNISGIHGQEGKEIFLVAPINQAKTDLCVQVIEQSNNGAQTSAENRKIINALHFYITVRSARNCKPITWQTQTVVALSSVCVILTSMLAIMLILYRQKGLLKCGDDDEDDDEDEDEQRMRRNKLSGGNFPDQSFINPRRTSSYDFNTLPKHNEVSTHERKISEESE